MEQAPQKLMMVKDKHKLYVAMAGTQSWNDWIIDLAASTHPSSILPGSHIHYGRFIT